jgi:hypothetical protein
MFTGTQAKQLTFQFRELGKMGTVPQLSLLKQFSAKSSWRGWEQYLLQCDSLLLSLPDSHRFCWLNAFQFANLTMLIDCFTETGFPKPCCHHGSLISFLFNTFPNSQLLKANIPNKRLSLPWNSMYLNHLLIINLIAKYLSIYLST